MKKILIIEDDKNLNMGLSIAFSSDYEVISRYSIEESRELLESVDLILLDMNLPDGDGLDLLEDLRKSSDVPVVVISVRDMEIDIIRAIQLGADDYITKPFSLGILQAKVNRILERWELKKGEVYSKGEFNFDFDKREFYVNRSRVYLTVTEEKILFFLIKSIGKVMSRELLLEKVWGIDENFIDSNTLSVNVNRLRKKLEPYEPIETIYGVGYKWNY